MTTIRGVNDGAVHFNPNHDDRGEFSAGGSGSGRTAESLYGGNSGFMAGMSNKVGGGHIVIYRARDQGIDAPGYLVMHEPSSLHILVRTLSQAKAIMKGVATAKTHEEAARHADILPRRGA